MSEMAFRLDDTCKGRVARCEMRVLGRSDDVRLTKEGSTRDRNIAVLEEGATTSVQRKNGLNRQSRFRRFVIERLDWSDRCSNDWSLPLAKLTFA
jgi:hypothetical protein